MSLKAKLEAVIYAAEEPVTLNQLAALFAADALEWKAAQAAAAAEQAAQVADESHAEAQPLPLLAAGLEYLGLSESPAVYADLAAQGTALEQPLEGVTLETSGEDSSGDTVAEPTPGGEQAEAESTDEGALAGEIAPAPVDGEAELKRMARQRDREVRAILKQLLDELVASYASDGRGVEIREIAGGYRMATKPECHDAVRLFVKSLKPAMKLSLPALETLAVIAYKQPVTAPEVNEIRGVESGGVLGSLLARKLIATAGRKHVIGRPILYKTTREFLLRFGLKDVSELPSMEEFEKMAAIELEEPEPANGVAAETTAALDAEQGGAEAELEFNSPSGEELAESTEALEDAVESTESVTGAEPANEGPDPAKAGATDPAMEEPPAEPNPAEDADAKPAMHEQAEIEAVPHAEEEQKEH